MTTPLDVVKTRITLDRKQNQKLIIKWKIINTFRDIIKENGFKGYYRRKKKLLIILTKYKFIFIYTYRLFAGIYPRVTMISSGGFIFFGIYEETKKIILNCIN